MTKFDQATAEYIEVTFDSVYLTKMLCVGLIGEKQISAYSICFQAEGFAWMVIYIVSCVILCIYIQFIF